MDIHDILLSCFPNTIDKESKEFGAIVANSNRTGTFEQTLNTVKKFIAQWTGTPDLYKQTGEMLDLTSNFFSFFERYTDESDEAFLKRIKTIFQHGGDTKWGNPYDIKRLFKEFFPSAKIYLIENTNHIDDDLIKDGDFQAKSESWIGIDSDIKSNCHYTKGARFSKSYGVEFYKDADFYQEVKNNNSDKTYYVGAGEDYSIIAKHEYGNELLDDYIRKYESNPETISGPVKGCGKVVFSRKIALNKECTIPSGTVVTNGTIDYVTKEDAIILADTSARKATGEIIFSRATQMDEVTEIPTGTIVSDGNLNFITIEDGVIASRAITSNRIKIEAENVGDEYNVMANTISEIVSSISSDIVSVINPNDIKNGFNGNELHSNNVIVESIPTGNITNTPKETINKIVSELDEQLTVTNYEAITNGYDGDAILIPSRKTYFLHFFLNGKIKVEITDNNGRYWNNKHYFDKEKALWVDGGWQETEYAIEYDSVAEMEIKNKDPDIENDFKVVPTKASGNVYFTCIKSPSERVEIPIGTRVSDGTLIYTTTTRGYIAPGQTKSQEVEVVAENSGWEYNKDPNEVNVILDPIVGIDAVYNEKEIGGGTNSDWTPESLYLYTDNLVENITVKFIALDRSYIDYVRLFEKQPYPSFTVIAQFQTYSGIEAAALYPGEEDPVILPSHENASYFDNDYFTGVSNGGFSQDIYQDIMDYARSVGVKAYVEIVNKDDE